MYLVGKSGTSSTTKEAQNNTPIILLHGGPGVPHNYLLNLSH